MRYSIEPKYSQKLLDSAKKSTTDLIKTASKREIERTAEATSDLIVHKIADKITYVSKKSSQSTVKCEVEIPKERYISPKRRQASR